MPDQGLQTAKEVAVVTDEKLVLATLADNFREGSLAFSDDGEHVAYVVRTDAGQQVVSSDGPLSDSTFKQCSRPRFSPKAGKIFYWALDTSSGSEVITLVAGGTPIATEFASEGSLTFSNDGTRWVAVGGTRETREGDKIIRGPTIAILDGTEIGRYPDMSDPAFSVDGEELAYIVENEEGRYALVINGETKRVFEEPSGECSFVVKPYVVGPNIHHLFSVRYLANGSIVTLAESRNCWTIHADDKELAAYHISFIGRLGRNLPVSA